VGLAFNTNSSLRFFCASTNVRGENDVLEAAEFLLPAVEIVGEVVAIGTWLAGVHVESRTGDLAATRGIDQGRNVDDSTTAGVDQI